MCDGLRVPQTDEAMGRKLEVVEFMKASLSSSNDVIDRRIEANELSEDHKTSKITRREKSRNWTILVKRVTQMRKYKRDGLRRGKSLHSSFWSSLKNM
uniref:Ovule protein n=1 Tax=Caenorhabditis tropicalis TaxID=1561998 RepID=A0A1I7TXT8_9PELO